VNKQIFSFCDQGGCQMNGQTSSEEPRLNTATKLAFERTRVAYERTMMAWIRTATSLIAFGFSVYKFFEIEDGHLRPMLISPRRFGIILIAVGLLSLLLGLIEHARDMRLLRVQYQEMPRPASVWVGLVIGALGLLALVAVILRA
jgi:putative membrane protein